MFTPLSALAFSTLADDLRTDAAGVYSLLRQLGCATGVAVMTAVLQARIQTNLDGSAPYGAGDGPPPHLLDAAKFAAYAGAFRTMAIITAVVIPGVLSVPRVAAQDRGVSGRVGRPSLHLQRISTGIHEG